MRYLVVLFALLMLVTVPARAETIAVIGTGAVGGGPNFEFHLRPADP